jgi:uncharacterized protein
MAPSARPDEGALCVVVHDVSPATWTACGYLLDALAEVAPYRATLLVVPQYHTGPHAGDDRGFCAALAKRLDAGDELVLHGLTHHDDAPVTSPWQMLRRRFYTAGEGEFAALTEESALARITAGIDWFAKEGWPLHGFVAPAWLMSAGTLKALHRTALTYTTTLGGIHLLRNGQSVASQSLVFSSRSAWRRKASHVFADVLKHRLTDAPVVRLGLHPADAAYPEIVAHWQSLFAHFREARESMTKARFVQQFSSHAKVAAPEGRSALLLD